MGGITYPLLSDFWPHGAASSAYGVLRSDVGYTERAIFVIDEEGCLRYIDIHDEDDQPTNEDVLRVLRQLNPELAARQMELNPPQLTELPSGGIVLYCTRWCPGCRRARAWLKERGFEYTEIDIDNNPIAAEQVRQWANGNLTTPTFDIEGTIVVDYNERRLNELLPRKSSPE